MKNIQVIDGALNCTYSLFAASERDYKAIFPDGTDVAFPDEIFARLGEGNGQGLLERLWAHPVNKKKARGIHGTIFFGLDEKKGLYPTRQEAGMDPNSYSAAQRKVLTHLTGRREGAISGNPFK